MSTAEWILSVAATLIATAVTALFGRELSHEHRITALETKVEYWDELLERVEKKLDELLSRRRSRGS